MCCCTAAARRLAQLPAAHAAQLASMQSLVHAWHRANGSTWNSENWRDKTARLQLQQAELLAALPEADAAELSECCRAPNS
jgi:hypothetical protein